MPRDSVSRTANVGTVGKNGLKARVRCYLSMSCTRRNLFEILLNQTEIRLYSLFSDSFGSKPTSVWIQINRKMVNTTLFQVDLIRFRKNFSVCIRPLCVSGSDDQILEKRLRHGVLYFEVNL